MPVTLVAVADELPEYPGFAFGLASLALAVGAFPVLAGAPVKLTTGGTVALVVLASAAALFLALRMLAPGAQAPHTLAETTTEAAK
jgi:hypothetical protein